MTTTRWTHADGSADHDVDPHYNANGRPAWWTCHASTGKGQRCDAKLKLDGASPPIAVPAKGATDDAEPPLSAQP